MKLINKDKLIEIITDTKQEEFDSTDIERLINCYGDTWFLGELKSTEKGKIHTSGNKITLE